VRVIGGSAGGRRLKNPPAGESPRQKQAREDAIAIRQQQLKQQHKDLTDQLNDLMKRRPELVDAARNQQLDKLAELVDEFEVLLKETGKIKG